jgi:hypothetical protein
MLGGLLLVILAFLVGSTNALSYIPREAAVPKIDFKLCLISGFVLLFFGFRATAQAKPAGDLSTLQAALWMGLAFVAAAALRLYQMDVPHGGWWSDQTVSTGYGWDAFIKHQWPLMTSDSGCRPGFPTWVEIAVLSLFPDLSAPAMLRVTGTVLDGFSLGIFYLLGKELGGRRTGVIMAAMAAVSREMILKLFWGFDLSSYVFVAGLALLVFFRLIHKPSYWRFIQWGAATAFGLYCYNGYRAWIPFLFAVVPFWILSHPQERKWGLWGYLLALVPPVVWLAWFFRAGHIIPPDSYLGSVQSNWLFWTLAGLAALCAMRILAGLKKAGSGHLLLGWALGLSVAAVIFRPLSLHPIFAGRAHSVLDIKPLLNPSTFIQFCSDKLADLYQVVLLDGRMDYFGPIHETFFSLHALVLIFLGLAFFLAKPSKDKMWLALFVVPAVAPYALTGTTHTGRLMGAVPVFYLLAALALDRYWAIFSIKAGNWVARLLGLTLLGAFWAWSGWANFHSVWTWSNIKEAAAFMYDEATIETKNGRVYLARFERTTYGDMDQLVDRRPIYWLWPSNAIYLSPGQKTPDVIVLCLTGDEKNEQLLRKEFPKAIWAFATDRPSAFSRTRYLWRVRIPADQITSNPKKLLFTREIPPEGWTRKYYSISSGIARGIVFFEDAVADLRAPFPAKEAPWIAGAALSCRFERAFTVEKPGPYEFTVKTYGCIRLSLERDKKYKIAKRNSYTPKEVTDTRTIRLDKGEYKVEYCYYRPGGQPPKVTIRFPDGTTGEW